MTLPERLKEARAKKGLTQQELADAAKVSLRSVSKLEMGHTEDPGIGTIDRLAGVLECSLDWLVHGKTEATESGSDAA